MAKILKKIKFKKLKFLLIIKKNKKYIDEIDKIKSGKNGPLTSAGGKINNKYVRCFLLFKFNIFLNSKYLKFFL